VIFPFPDAELAVDLFPCLLFEIGATNLSSRDRSGFRSYNFSSRNCFTSARLALRM
jgi:hypothetical protein